eukprot:GHVU01048796.1.p1 GENE.GHVU01048796.1~~GHVU01048796.1.p1  ORF type:complete len:815 (+),score=112.47 GHVU01048796.1:107-2551(+)
MPPQKGEHWRHFEKRDECEKSTHAMVSCRYCDRVAERIAVANETDPIYKTMISKREKLEKHLLDCTHYRQYKRLQEQEQGGGAPSTGRVSTAASAVADADHHHDATATGQVPAGARTLRFGVADSKLFYQTYFDLAFTEEGKGEFRRQCIRVAAACNVSATFFQEPTVMELFQLVRPAAVEALPKPDMVTGHRLTAMASEAKDAFLVDMRKETANGKCLAVKGDAWKNIAGHHQFGVIVQCGSSTFSFEDAVGKHVGNVDRSYAYHGIAVATVLEGACERIEEFCGKPPEAICTDEAGQYRRAKDILAYRRPHMYLGKCYAHWGCGVFKKIFFKAHLKAEVTLVTAIVDCFRSSDPWANRLHDKMTDFYGKPLALYRAVAERWTTLQYSLASVLRVWGAVVSVAHDHHHLPDAPECLKELVHDAPQLQRRLQQAETLARPITQAVLWMERGDVTLADVLYMMASMRETLHAAGEVYSEVVELRWTLEEQPILLVAALLSTKYVADFRRRIQQSSQLTASHMAYFVVGYYKKFIGDDTSGLDSGALRWVKGEVKQEAFCSPDCLWSLLRDGDDPGLQKLATIAEFVGSLPATTADVERLFSEFSYIHNKQRNRLGPAKVHYLSQVKRQIKKQQWDKETRKRKNRRRILQPVERARVAQPGQVSARIPIVAEHVSEDEAAVAECQPVPNGYGVVEVQGLEPHRQESSGEAMQVVVELMEENEDEAWPQEPQAEPQANLSTEEIAAEVASATHSTGEDFRWDNPFPRNGANDKNYPQQPRRFPGSRGWRIRLGELFRQGRDLPSLPELPNLLCPFVD